MKKIFTLCIVFNEKKDKVLLGMKKIGFGAGRWNGFGGKVEQGETIAQAALRELSEEADIKATEIKELGVLDFSFQEDPNLLEVHIFRVDSFTGEPKESNEMKPQWFTLDQIPFEHMWSDDVHWFPLLIQGKKFAGQFVFDRPSNAEYSAKIITKNLLIVESL